MIKHLLPAKKYASRVLPQPSDLRLLMVKHKTVVISMAMSFLVVMTMGMMAVNATMNDEIQMSKNIEDHADGKSVTASVITTSPHEVGGGESVSSNESTTNVTVNDKPVVIVNDEQAVNSTNGNYSKTITTENGTTHVNVSNNAETTGGGFMTSTSMTHTNISGTSLTNDVYIYTSQ